MRVIFVGLHNKPDLNPLDSSTKSGRLIDRIIKKLDSDLESVKTNLFNVDYFGEIKDSIKLQEEWYWTNLPTYEDIIVLLGAYVHKAFMYDLEYIIKVAHPASKNSHKEMNNYVDYVSSMINEIHKTFIEIQ